MPIPQLLTHNVDMYSRTLACHSFTDLLTLLTTSHTLHSSLSHHRTRTALLLSACHLSQSQAREQSEADVKALLAVLSCVERRLLNGRTIAPLHTSLLVQSLLTATSSSSASTSYSFNVSARLLLSSALSSSPPFLSCFFSPAPITVNRATVPSTTAPSPQLLSCPTLQSLSQPHLSLWLRNPFHSTGFLTEWAAQHKPQRPNTATPANGSHLAAVRDTLDKRILWLGSWRDDRQSLSCFGLYFGTVDRTRDAQHRFDLRQLPYTSVAD